MKLLKVMASLLVFVGAAVQARTININYGDGTTIVDPSDTLVCKFTVTTLGVDLSTGIPRFESFSREADPRLPDEIPDEQKIIEDVTNNAVSISVTEHRMQPQCLPYVIKSKSYVKQGNLDNPDPKFLETIDLNLTYEALKDWQTNRVRKR